MADPAAEKTSTEDSKVDKSSEQKPQDNTSPGLDPNSDPKVVVNAANPPITPDQVVSMAESPSAVTLPDVKLQNIKISPVKNKTIQGHLAAIEAKMIATEKLMADVVKLQKQQIVTEKELHQRRRELYQNTFEEYLLDKTIDFEGNDDPFNDIKRRKKKGGFGFPFVGGGKGKPTGGGGDDTSDAATEPTTAAERLIAGEESGLSNLGADYKKQEQDAIKRAQEFEKRKQQETKVAPRGLPQPGEQETEVDPNSPMVEEPAEMPIPHLVPIKTKPKADPADLEIEIEALKHLYEQQTTFTGGMVGNMIPAEAQIHERDDGYVIIVSPHARQAGEGVNPFVNGGKVRILPPTVSVLRPEDVAAIKSSDAAKVVQVMEVFNAIQDVLSAIYGAGTKRGRTSTGRTTSGAHTRVTKPTINKAVNNIRRIKRLKAKNTINPGPSNASNARVTTPKSSPVPHASGGVPSGGRDMNLYHSKSREYFRNVSSKLQIPKFADGGFNLLNPMSWFRGDLDKATKGELTNVSDDTLAGKLYNRRMQQEKMMRQMGYAGGGIVDWWNKGRNARVPNENTARWRGPDGLMADDAKQLTRTNKAFKSGASGVKGWRPWKAFTPGMVKTGPTPAVRQAFERPVRAVRGTVKPGHPLVMLAEAIINELINPQPTATYDQVTGPNAYYNMPGYKGPMPSQNLENAQNTMMNETSNQQPQIVPLPPDYIKLPGKPKGKTYDTFEVPGIDLEPNVFTRSSRYNN